MVVGGGGGSEGLTIPRLSSLSRPNFLWYFGIPFHLNFEQNFSLLALGLRCAALQFSPYTHTQPTSH